MNEKYEISMGEDIVAVRYRAKQRELALGCACGSRGAVDALIAGAIDYIEAQGLNGPTQREERKVKRGSRVWIGLAPLPENAAIPALRWLEKQYVMRQVRSFERLMR